MADCHPSTGRPWAHGLALLERTPEDEAAGIFRVRAPGGAIGQLTARQVEIVSMSPDQKHHVPRDESVELGRTILEIQRGNMDIILQKWDEHPFPAPDFVPEPYEYTALKKPTSLRLLQLISEDEDGMLHISLDEYDLDNHIPSYYCLSYCWNNPHAKSNTFDFHADRSGDYDERNLFPISCNGRLLYVRANLYDALKQLPAAPDLQLKRWYDLNGSDEKWTGLHVSAAEGDLGLTKTNIFRGASLDTRDIKGRTALGLATINGHLDVVQSLLEAGADPQICDYDGFNCLEYALRHDHHKIADYLLTFNPDGVKRYQRKNKHVGHGVKTWIDAICINQQDLQEKNEQVSVMDRIYSQADFVTIRLGRDDGSAALASSAIRKLFSIAATDRYSIETELVLYGVADPDACRRAGLPYVSPAEWVSLAALYLRQQFRRIWCLQEAVLGGDVAMFLGEHEIPWDEFMMVTEQLYMWQKKYAVPPSAKFRPVYTAPIESEAHLISELRMRKALDELSPERRAEWFKNKKRFWRGEDERCRIPLLEMIFSTITFDCSDPRDHIYALIGLCKDHPESPHIEVDYAKPWEELYTDVMRLCLNVQKEFPLYLVTLIRDSALYSNENLPSWVLHFGQAGLAPFWSHHHAAAGEGSRQRDVNRSLSDRKNELLLEGKRLDSIKDTAMQRPGGEQVSMYNFDLTWPLLVLSLPQLYRHTQQSRTEVLWRTLCRDSPSKEDIETSRGEHTKAEQSTSAEPLSESSKAPATYGGQFREQLYASILSHAEKQADQALKMRNSPEGILLQAMLSLQVLRDEDEGGSSTRVIRAPSEAELLEIRDTSLEGPYFSDPASTQAIEGFESLYQTDLRRFGGPGCSTPSRADIAAFLQTPTFRVWHPNSNDPSPEVNIVKPFFSLSTDVQLSSKRPPDQSGFYTQFSRFNGGRRLFTTETQQYLGLGAMSMRAGDEVWIVKGSKVPLLLRKLGEEELEDEELDDEVG